MRAPTQHPLWADDLCRLEEAARAVEAATAALVDLSECDPDAHDESDRRAFDALAVAGHLIWSTQRSLRGERLPAPALAAEPAVT
jgi:hypothetical protein